MLNVIKWFNVEKESKADWKVASGILYRFELNIYRFKMFI